MRSRIQSPTSALAAMLLVALLLPARANAQSEPQLATPQQSPGLPAQIFDAAIVRPVCFVGTAIGAVFFVPAAIVTAPGGLDAIEHALDVFVLAPGKYVFQRPLGDF